MTTDRTSGFTLVELITVMSIAAILMAIAVPSYRYVTTSNRMSSEVNSLLGDMQYARAEAIKEGQTVTVCQSQDGATCSVTSWASGWIVFSDPNNNQTVDAGETIWRARTSFTNSNSSDTFISTVSAVTFNREGFAYAGLTTTTATFTLHNAPYVAGFTRCLQLSGSGSLITVLGGATGCT